MPGLDVTTRDYMVKVAEGLAPLSAALNLRSINDGSASASFQLPPRAVPAPPGRRAREDWSSLNANAKYYNQTRASRR